MNVLCDVIEVSLDSNKVLGFMGENKTCANAEAIEMMAVMRRGVMNSFYAVVPAGSYKVGDAWKGGEADCG